MAEWASRWLRLGRYWYGLDGLRPRRLPVIQGGLAMDPTFDQNVWAHILDDGNEAGSTISAESASDGGWTQGVDAVFRVRFEIVETANNNGAGSTAQLQFFHTEGAAAWTNIGAGTAIQNAISAESAWTITDGDATTDRLTGDAGVFGAGEYSEDGLTGSVTIAKVALSEFEYCVTIDSAQVSNADTILLRVILSETQGTPTYGATPTITVNSQNIQSGALSSAGSGSMSATGASIVAGVLSAAAVGAMALTGAATVEGAVSSAGSSVLSGSGTAIHEGVLTAAGSGSGSFVGISVSIQSGAMSSAGSGVMAATGESTVGGELSAAAVGAMSNAGASDVEGVLSAASVGSLSGGGASDVEGVLSGSGSGAFAGVGTAIHEGVLTAAGSGSGSFVGDTVGGITAGAMTSAGAGVLSGAGASDVEGVLSAAAVGSMALTGAADVEGVFTSAGAGAASHVGTAVHAGALTAAGSGSASLVGDIVTGGIVSGAMSSAGSGSAAFVGEAITRGVLSAAAVGSMANTGQPTVESVLTAAGLGSGSFSGGLVRAGVMSASGVGAFLPRSPGILRIPEQGCFSWQLPVSAFQSTVPGGPSKGDRYAVTGSPVAPWAGQADSIAWFDGLNWQFDAPSEGWMTWDEATMGAFVFTSGTWAAFPVAGTPGVSGIARMDGVGLAQFQGASIVAGAMTAVGGGAFGGVGASDVEAVLSAAAAGALNATGLLILQGILSASGVGAMSNVGGSTVEGVLSASAVGTMAFTGAPIAEGVMSSSGGGLMGATGAYAGVRDGGVFSTDRSASSVTGAATWEAVGINVRLAGGTGSVTAHCERRTSNVSTAAQLRVVRLPSTVMVTGAAYNANTAWDSEDLTFTPTAGQFDYQLQLLGDATNRVFGVGQI